MTKTQKLCYSEPEALRDILTRILHGKKFRLECGHYVTFGHFFGNNIIVFNGKKLKIICTECAY